MKFKVAHEIDVPAATFWQHLFDPALEHAASAKVALEHEVEECEERNGVTTRKVRTIPNVDLPGPLKKLFGARVTYHQFERIPKTGMRYELTVQPTILTNKVSVTAEFIVEPVSEKRCRRIIQGDISVKIFGIGSFAEKYIVDELDKNYAIVAREQERWLKENA